MSAPFVYPYDPIGDNPLSLIADESHAVVPPTRIGDASFIRFRGGPAHVSSIIVESGTQSTRVTLNEGEHYDLVYKHLTASRVLEKDFVGGIILKNRAFNGTIWITYQVLGGNFVVNSPEIIAAFSRSLHNIRYLTFESIAGLPEGFPTANHVVEGDTLINLENVADAIAGVGAAINAQGGGGESAPLQAHIDALLAHTKAQVGLSLLNNWGVASLAGVQAGVINAYVNAAVLKQYVESVLPTDAIEEIQDALTAIETTVTGHGVSITNLGLTLNNAADAIAVLEDAVEDIILWADGVDDAITAILGDITTLFTQVSTATSTANAALTNANNALSRIAAGEFQGSFTQGSFDFLIRPNHTKNIVIAAPGGNGGSVVADALDYVPQLPAGYVELQRRTNLSTGTNLAVPVSVVLVNGGQDGGHTFEPTRYGTGGAGGTITLNSAEVDVSPTPVTTVGSDGEDGADTQTVDTVGGAGHVVGADAFGFGSDGSPKAGAGGSGGYCSFSITNTSAHAQRYTLIIQYAVPVTALQSNDQRAVVMVEHVVI